MCARLYVVEELTKLYPGAHCSNRDLVDFFQVVFDIIFGHSVQKYTKREQHRGLCADY